jgi:hypothetical protein
MSIGWIHFSSDHRKKVQLVIDLLNKGGVVDELGIGIIRDSYADTMFPGISTIQTRAKYFTLTAHLLKNYVEKHKTERINLSLEAYLKKVELDCRIQMMENSQSEEDQAGVIGTTFGKNRAKDVVRRASSIYWNGLRTFGFLDTKKSLSEFSRDLGNQEATLDKLLAETSKTKGDDIDAEYSLPLVKSPRLPGNYLETLSINLLPAEAKYLRSQIESNKPDSLIGRILQSTEATTEFIELSKYSFSKFCELPFLKDLNGSFLQKVVISANKFWEIFYGAHIRYNCLLQKQYSNSTKYDEFQSLWNDWMEGLSKHLYNWDTEFLFEILDLNKRAIKPQSEKFVRGWINEISKKNIDVDKCDQLVIAQEKFNKVKRARLGPGNSEVIEDWIGLRTLNYRLPEAHRIVSDIVAAEKEFSNA